MAAAVTSMGPMTSVLTSSPVATMFEQLVTHINKVPGYSAECTQDAKKVYATHAQASNLEDCSGKNTLVITSLDNPEFLLYYGEDDFSDPEDVRLAYNHQMLLGAVPEVQTSCKKHNIQLKVTTWTATERSLSADVTTILQFTGYSFTDSGEIHEASSRVAKSKSKKVCLSDSLGHPVYFDDRGNFLLRALVGALVGKDTTSLYDVPEMVSSSLYFPRS